MWPYEIGQSRERNASMLQTIPRSVATVIGDVIGGAIYSHRKIETLCYECGFTGEPPEGNCANKITSWIVREGQTRGSAVFACTGKLIESFMDGDRPIESDLKNRDRIRRMLAENGLHYQQGGHIYGASASAPAKSLDDYLQERDVPGIEREFHRALESVVSDPAAAITAACAILEAFCRTYILTNGLELPSDLSAKPLWKTVARHLGLATADQTSRDLQTICTGLAAVVDGIACLRTHDGSAHGREEREYDVSPRQARLAIHAAHTLVLFGLETWSEDAR
jgi:hypothetical protein